MLTRLGGKEKQDPAPMQPGPGLYGVYSINLGQLCGAITPTLSLPRQGGEDLFLPPDGGRLGWG